MKNHLCLRSDISSMAEATDPASPLCLGEPSGRSYQNRNCHDCNSHSV